MARRKKKDGALDLVDQLLNNETPKKRGRPKGSKSKKRIRSTKITVDDSPSISKIGVRRRKGKIEPPRFVSDEEYVALGSPQFTHTTCRIRQWTNKTERYYEVLLEYHRAAILWSKLLKAINWYSVMSDREMALCKKEIEDFRINNGLTIHDMAEVIQISHSNKHNRKVLIRELRKVAGYVMEYRKKNAETIKEEKAITLKSVSDVPPNVRPTLNHVVVAKAISLEEDVRGAIADLTGNAQVLSELACIDHPLNKGLRKPRNGCFICMEFYLANKEKGVKEKRTRE